MGYFFVQVGAGAGDRDSRANYRDGFTEYVKSLERDAIDKIILVEPNPVNIPLLKECWRDYPQAEILQIGVRSSGKSQANIEFYYAEEDGPHFQTCSMNLDHVLKHYPNGTIKKIDVETDTIGAFFDRYRNNHIDLISLDVEGIDADIILDADWRDVDIYRISFEYIHLGSRFESVLKHLYDCNFHFVGLGVDTSHFDLLFEKNDAENKYLNLKHHIIGHVKLGLLKLAIDLRNRKLKSLIERLL